MLCSRFIKLQQHEIPTTKYTRDNFRFGTSAHSTTIFNQRQIENTPITQLKIINITILSVRAVAHDSRVHSAEKLPAYS